jgi:hypothetical protein
MIRSVQFGISRSSSGISNADRAMNTQINGAAAFA